MILEHLQEKIKEVVATSVVVGDLPSRVINCVAVRPIDGYSSVYYFGKVSSNEPLVEVIVRNKKYQEGQVAYQKIQQLLDKYSSEEQGIDSCFLTGSPGYLGADENGFNEWHMIFHLTIFERSGLSG